MARDEILDKLNSDFNRKKYTNEEIRAVSDYTCSSYELFSLASMASEEKKNASLIDKRKALEKIIKIPISEINNIPKDILVIFENLIAKSCTPCPLVLYRGTSIKHFLATNLLNNDPSYNAIEAGVSYKSLTYTSASIDLCVAKTFTSKHDPLIIEYHLPKYYKALWAEPMSIQSESELILMKNKLLQITEVHDIQKPNGRSNIKFIRVEPIKKPIK